MLILVGVTVTVALNGGLFDKAKEAVQRTSREKAIEELNIITADFTAELYMEPDKYCKNNGEIDWNKLLAEIEKRILEENKENPDSSIITNLDLSNADEATVLDILYGSPKEGYGVEIRFKYKGVYAKWKIPFDVSGENGFGAVELDLEGKTLVSMYREGENCTERHCTNENHLHKGDFVTYTPTTVSTPYNPDKGEITGKYTGYTTETQSIGQEKLYWRVLGLGGDNILLISTTPTEQKLTLYGYVGYNNFKSVLKETCEALYSNKEIGATARSITMDDIDTYFGGSKYDKTSYGQPGTSEDRSI